jgi:hypothetical protein
MKILRGQNCDGCVCRIYIYIHTPALYIYVCICLHEEIEREKEREKERRRKASGDRVDYKKKSPTCSVMNIRRGIVIGFPPPQTPNSRPLKEKI